MIGPDAKEAIPAQGKTMVADCLHAGMCGAAQRSPLLTFDRLASKMPGVVRLQA